MIDKSPYVMTNSPDDSGQIAKDGDTFKCSVCGKEYPALTPATPSTDGRLRFANFAVWDSEGKSTKFCFDCDKDMWLKYLAAIPPKARVSLYLCKGKDGRYYAGPFHDNLRLPAQITHGRHNWRNVQRTDAWFTTPDGAHWHGINLGDNQILRASKLVS